MTRTGADLEPSGLCFFLGPSAQGLGINSDIDAVQRETPVVCHAVSGPRASQALGSRHISHSTGSSRAWTRFGQIHSGPGPGDALGVGT